LIRRLQSLCNHLELCTIFPPGSSGRVARVRQKDTKDSERGHRAREQASQGGRALRKNRHIGSTLDDFLAEEGVLEGFQAQAIKEVIAWQLAQASHRPTYAMQQTAFLFDHLVGAAEQCQRKRQAK
jgi:hypothetical protein